MFDRLSKYYRLVTEDSDKGMSVIWKTIVDQFHQKLCSILWDKDEGDFKDYMRQVMLAGDLHGIEQVHSLAVGNEQYLDLLTRLARKTGVLPIENPEQVSQSNGIGDNLEIIQRRVEQRLGFRLSSPKCQAYFGGIPHRLFHYAAAAFDIRLQCRGSFPKRILEIGAGLGNLGIISKQLGTASYTIIDLPTTSVLSAYFLAECFGESNVWLYGEDAPTRQFIRVYPSTRIDDVTTTFSLVFNSDSLPEIPPESQDRYIDLIAKRLSHDGIFFSVNHESDNLGQQSVHAACLRNKSMKLLSRSPFMMRDGYIQEAYYVHTP